MFPELVLMSSCLFDSRVCSVGFALVHCVTRCGDVLGVDGGAFLAEKQWASKRVWLYFCLRVPGVFEV